MIKLDHTLEVLTWHFISFKLASLLVIWLHGLPIEQLACFPAIREYAAVYWPLYTLVGVGVPMVGCALKLRFSNGVTPPC